MEAFLQIGVITSAHGVHGECKVFPMTDDPRRFSELDEVIVEKNGRRAVRRVQGAKYFKNMVILKLEGSDTMNDAEKMRESALFVPREKAVALQEDEYYIADMIGMRVITDEGEALGILTDVMQTGANDVYIVNSEHYGEILIPAIKDCIIKVDAEAGEMSVHLLPGLIGQQAETKAPENTGAAVRKK